MSFKKPSLHTAAFLVIILPALLLSAEETLQQDTTVTDSHSINTPETIDSTFIKRKMDFESRLIGAFNDSLIDSSYARLKRNLKEAEQLGMVKELFHWFRYYAISWDDLSGSEKRSFLEKWVNDALSTENEAIRIHYRSLKFDCFRIFFVNPKIREKVHRSFWTNSRGFGVQIRPGQEIALQSSWNFPWQLYRECRKDYTIEVSRLTYDTAWQPLGYVNYLTQYIRNWSSRNQYNIRFDTAGVYRITVSGAFFFWCTYVHVSWLDGVLRNGRKNSGAIGTSWKDTIKPPYTVHIVSGLAEKSSTQTDITGLCRLGQSAQALKKSSYGKIVLEKEGSFAFLRNYSIDTLDNDSILCYLYTDRPVYRPGQTVYFRGVLKVFADEHTISDALCDSIPIFVKNHQGKKIYRRRLPIDQWGHFGDSLTIPKAKSVGFYTVSYDSGGISGCDLQMSARSKWSDSFAVRAYKKPEFTISLTPQKERYYNDDEVIITAKGHYFFGEPLVHVPVTVKWYEKEWDYFRYGRRGGYYRYGYHGAHKKKLLKKEVLAFDSTGVAQLRYSGKSRTPVRELHAHVTVSDESRREVRAETQVLLINRRPSLNVYGIGYRPNIDKPQPFKIDAYTASGKPYQGTVDIRIKKRIVTIHRQQVQLDSNGTGYFYFTFRRHGNYRIKASYMDEKNNRITDQQRLSLSKRSWNDRPMPTWFSMVSDKQVYDFGDTAVITVSTDLDSIPVSFAVEGTSFGEHKKLRIVKNTCSFQVPITRELGYNIFISCALSTPNKVIEREVQLSVRDTTVLLNVDLQGERNIEPGGTFSGQLRVTDETGEPAQAAMSVALVDEAIYEVEKNLEADPESDYTGTEDDNILAMIPDGRYVNKVRSRRDGISMVDVTPLWQRMDSELVDSAARQLKEVLLPYDSTIATSIHLRKIRYPLFLRLFGHREEIYARRMSRLTSFEPGSIYDRNDFRDLGYWSPSLITSPEGTAELSFKMPDDLTKWRFVARGSGKGKYLLTFQDSVVTKKSIMVKLEAPRVFRDGDTSVITSVVHNYSSEDVTAEVTFSIDSGQEIVALLSDTAAQTTLRQGETKRIDWLIHVLDAGSVRFRTAVHTPAGADAEIRTYPVLYNALQQGASETGILEHTTITDTIRFSTGKGCLPGSATLTVEYTPSLVYTMFNSLGYLTGYPYGCIEQTMSRFMPCMYVSDIMKKLDIRDETLSAVLPKYTKAGIDRLRLLLRPDGGWGWWGTNEADTRITSLVVQGLGYALTSDISSAYRTVAENLYTKGMRNVLVLIYRNSKKPETAINLAYCLIGNPHFKSVSKQVTAVFAKRDRLSTCGLAQLAECLSACGLKKERNTVINLIESRAQHKQDAVFWHGSKRISWYRSDEEATAYVVRALSRTQPKHPLLPKAVLWLSRAKKGNRWVSTKTTATVIHALSCYLENTGELEPDFTGTVTVNNSHTADFTITRASLDNWNNSITLPDSVLSEKTTIILSMEGKGHLYYDARLEYMTRGNYSQSLAEGIDISRNYTRREYSQRPGGKWKVKGKRLDCLAQQGEEIEVTLRITCDEPSEYIIIEDPVPAGMEVVKSYLDFGAKDRYGRVKPYTHVETLDDKIVFFLSDAPAKAVELKYLLRAETPGFFNAPPAQAELMYYPSVRGNTMATQVKILNGQKGN